MDRVEALTRVFCVLAGLVLGAGAVVFFLCTVRIGPRAVTAAVLGAVLIGAAAAVLLRRGLAGKDPDTESLGNLKLRRWS